MASGSGVTKGDIEAFGQQLGDFSSHELMKISKHFRPDLINVIANDIHTVVRELKANRVLTDQAAETYCQLEKHQEATNAAEELVRDLLSARTEVAIGLWKCLFALRSRWSHPNLHEMIEEIIQNGRGLLAEIHLNEFGHLLDPELKACQEEHKEILGEQTQCLKESSRTAQSEGEHFPLLSRYVELKMVSDVRFGTQSVHQHEALAAAGELNEYRVRHKMQTELEQITPDRLFRWSSRLAQIPRSVMISGVAGVGKTTLVQKFVFDWATGKHYQKFAFIFVFKFRDLNALKENVSLEWLIQQEYPKLGQKLEVILRDPEKLLFIFDGLDESQSNLDMSERRSTEFCMLPGDVKPVNVIVASLLKQKLMKGCSILLTSRPNKFMGLETRVLHRLATIVGFLVQERERYFHNFFQKAEVAKKALSHVRESQVLYTLCYNPSYCWITCTALKPCFVSEAQQGYPLPQTITQLFISYIKHMMESHTRELPGSGPELRAKLIGLGWLADYGLGNRVLVFDQVSLDAFKVEMCPFLTAFLVENVKGTNPSAGITYSFVHLTVQEFFAALVHYLDYNKDNFEDTMGKVKANQNGEYEIFSRFLSGLSHPATRVLLEEKLGKFSRVTTSQVITWLSETDCSSLLGAQRLDDKRKALNFFNVLFEAHNSLLVRQALGDSACVNMSELILSPVDCVILAYILSCCKGLECLNLDSCYIQDEGLEKLTPDLHKTKELNLRSNNLKDPAMKDLVSALKHKDCKLENLSLAANPFTETCCQDLAGGLLENQTLLNLDLNKNKLRDQGFAVLLEPFRNSRCKIRRLLIQENGLSNESCETLQSALAYNTTLQYLNLSGNLFTDLCAEEMASFILTCPALTELRLSLCDFTPKMGEQLKQLEKDRTGLKINV